MNLIEEFRKVDSILKKNKIIYWLDAGTLLWHYRNGFIKPDDKDIDVGAFYSQVVTKIDFIKKDAKENGFNLMVNDGKISFRKPDGTMITVFLVKRKGDFYWKECIFYDKHKRTADFLNYMILDGLTSFSQDIYEKTIKNRIIHLSKRFFMFLPKQPLYSILVYIGLKTRTLKHYTLYYPSKFFVDLKKVSFYGTKVYIPTDTEEFLEHCYGKEWRTPVKHWEDDGYYKFVTESSKRLII